jgi:D-serine deaminase-like pyridoxal phosphate-dependent protein
MRLQDLRTPAALVDPRVVGRNTERLSRRIAGHGARLRPHVKTHKTVEAGRLQVLGNFGGITVSTLAEARAFAAAGFRDITWAVPIPPAKAAEAAALARELEALHLLVDSDEAAAALETQATAGSRLSVFLKLDCGYHRAGVDPESPDSVRLARRLADAPHLDFRGVLAHAGHSYACRDPEEVRAVARQEREVSVDFADRLRDAGVRVPEVSIGSTPTVTWAESLEGVTEVRPGNYAFFDALQAAIGSCRLEDAAFSVLASVIGCYPARGRLVLDAGALALSKDPGPTHVDPECGFGAIRTLRDEAVPLRLVSLSQEHGAVDGPGDVVARFPVGTRLRVIPNHSCLASALHERYLVVEAERVVGEWRPVRGW